MKKFKVEVTITREYEVEVDENQYTDEYRKDWESVMWQLDDEDTQEAFAKCLAEQSARLGVHEFLEGFGKCEKSKEDADYYDSFEYHKEKCNKGMYIREIDEYVESSAEEVEDFD